MREHLISITAKDCEFTYTKGSGAGGQKRNKTSNAVRCVHKDSGARGYSEDTRSQHENKRIAFRRMADTETFRNWLKIESARALGKFKDLDNKVDAMMKDVVVEGIENGKWEPLK